MTRIKNPLRLALTTMFIFFTTIIIVVCMLDIINNKDYSHVDHLRTEDVPANRGNIYSCDNELLAVTSVRYDLRLDEEYALSVASSKDLEQLATDLSVVFTTKKSDYLNNFTDNIKNRYLLLKRNASFDQIEKVKSIDFYQKSLRGGIVIEEYLTREKPNLNSAARTIGDLYKDNSVPKYGLEYSYNSDLMGEDGQCLVLYEPGIGSRKINNSNNIDSKPGRDLITSIDLKLQDIVEESLLRQLEKYQADFGTAILMEVKTGQIKAITNLKKTKKDTYAEILNFAVTRQIEPGSTIKLASIMAYFEDFNGSIEDTIDCKNGRYRFAGSPIDTYDSKDLGVVSVKSAFAHSSNIGIGRLVQKYYAHNPEKFINRFYSFGLAEKSKIDLIGVPKPKILSPSDNTWSLIALPWMSFGYGINLTPLDILTFYNAVANNGYLIAPYLGVALREGSKVLPINRDNPTYTICSESTLQKINILLKEVVQNGTAKKLSYLPFSVSGKTGTTVKNYTNKKDQKSKEYQSSFVGFFPSEKPQYSCIVLIDSPNTEIGYYGSEVALPAFREIANKIYIKNGLAWNNIQYKNTVSNNHTASTVVDTIKFHNSSLHQDYYPNVVGMHIREALQLLKLDGHDVIVKGDFGNVIKQYPRPETPIKKDLAITLFI